MGNALPMSPYRQSAKSDLAGCPACCEEKDHCRFHCPKVDPKNQKQFMLPFGKEASTKKPKPSGLYGPY